MISVILPSYNSEKTIEVSILSVLNQTYSNLELIVVLNGCTDKTDDVVGRISKKDHDTGRHKWRPVHHENFFNVIEKKPIVLDRLKNFTLVVSG
jgi:glycosyltransferase involved in cell wall biosynthesis